MGRILKVIIKGFFILCLVMYVLLYYTHFVGTGYLTKVKGVDQVEVIVNSTSAAVITGTLCAFIIEIFFRPKYIRRRLLSWPVLILSGFSGWIVVAVSALLYCSKQLAAFISASIIKGSVYPAAYKVDGLAGIKGLKQRDENQKKDDKLGLILAIAGIALMVFGSYIAKKNKMTGSFLGWFIVFLIIGAIFYSVAYGIRQYILLLYKKELNQDLMSVAEAEKPAEVLRVLAQLFKYEQLGIFAFFILTMASAWKFGYLDRVHFNAQAALAGITFGALAFFSTMIMSVPLKSGKDDVTMALRTRIHKAGGTLPGLLATATIALYFHKDNPNWLEYSGAFVVILAIFSGALRKKFGPYLSSWGKRLYAFGVVIRLIRQPTRVSPSIAR